MNEENILIGDYTFTGVTLSIDNSEPYRELVTTKVMNGTSRHRFGEWQPIKFSVTVPWEFEDPAGCTELVRNLHGTIQEVLCPYVNDDLFNAFIKVSMELIGANMFVFTFDIEQVGDEEEFLPVSDLNGFILEEE